MPWNASGQPIGKGVKPPAPMENNTAGGANFWDDVMGISSPSNNKMNGPNNGNQQQRGGQSKKGGMRFE